MRMQRTSTCRTPFDLLRFSMSMAAIAALVSCATPSATTQFAAVTFPRVPAARLEVEPYAGVDLINMQPRNRCVTAQAQWTGSGTLQGRTIKLSSSEEYWGESSSGSGGASIGYNVNGDSLAGAIASVRSHAASSYSLVAYLDFDADFGAQGLSYQSLALTPEARALLANPVEFRRFCGDALVLGREFGARVVVQLQRRYADRRSLQSDASELSGATNGWSGSSQQTSAASRVFSERHTRANIVVNSGDARPLPEALDFQSLYNWARQGPVTSEAARVRSWLVLKYEDVPSLMQDFQSWHTESNSLLGREWAHYLAVSRVLTTYRTILDGSLREPTPTGDRELFAGQSRDNVRAYVPMLEREQRSSAQWIADCAAPVANRTRTSEPDCRERRRLELIEAPPLPSESDWRTYEGVEIGEWGVDPDAQGRCRTQDRQVVAPQDNRTGYRVEGRGQWYNHYPDSLTNFDPAIRRPQISGWPSGRWLLASDLVNDASGLISPGERFDVAAIDLCGNIRDNAGHSAAVRLVGALLPRMPRSN